VMAEAGAGEVAMSSVTRELLAGSELRFESIGIRALKGIDGELEVFRLVP
jgi:class 3 adenylate cyclase